MKKGFLVQLIATLVSFAMPIVAIAQDVVIPPISNEQFFLDLVAAYGGAQGLAGLALALLVVQLLMKFLGTPIFDLLGLSGGWKLTVASFLHLAAGVIASMTAGGLSLGAALFAGGNLVALGVFLNQVYKQYQEPSVAK